MVVAVVDINLEVEGEVCVFVCPRASVRARVFVVHLKVDTGRAAKFGKPHSAGTRLPIFGIPSGGFLKFCPEVFWWGWL